ncbi:heat-inducible transcription repressor HrcA [Thermoanaerobacter uzonensis DSM 18761]|uniref:Heat-inducible transcription repressor HrcA n=1 Tax=Thermoanaerobacter uzonensis DSM 18761 TaxID=1123369 RepID=A0A1M4Y4W9_9THEO|nr:heat-inducible transcriptional repressor HrcA [Thermoanaerobacter uzonensis]SHF00666.1 heat-inducible transcription repressor HrcA [Thermoanaerobacter uzonensis DSM 18761]
MPLDDRKKKILYAVITDYIMTAEPIGSRTIAKKYNIGLSSATIRNEMADLEEMGYLEQPHTSAGRIPSDKGYRFYVDSILRSYINNDSPISYNTREEIIAEFDEIVKKYAKILANITHHTTVAKMPRLNPDRIKRIQLIPVASNKIIFLVVTDTGIVKNHLLNLCQNVDRNVFEFLNNLLNDKISGKSEKDIFEFLEQDLRQMLGEMAFIADELINTILMSLKQLQETDIYADGTSHILDFPEYKDLSKAKNFFNLLENKLLLNEVLEPEVDFIDVRIGSENKFEEMKDLSVIKTTYKINGRVVGTIGIIGPTRMDYKKLISEINVMTKELSNLLSSIYNDEI